MTVTNLQNVQGGGGTFTADPGHYETQIPYRCYSDYCDEPDEWESNYGCTK